MKFEFIEKKILQQKENVKLVCKLVAEKLHLNKKTEEVEKELNAKLKDQETDTGNLLSAIPRYEFSTWHGKKPQYNLVQYFLYQEYFLYQGYFYILREH